MRERVPTNNNKNGEVILMQTVAQATTLEFGKGNVGLDRHLQGEQKTKFTDGLARHTHQIPKGLWLPVDCMDERQTIRLADGTTDPQKLKERAAGQLAGGLVLATTKAAVSANATYLRGIKSMQLAYEKTYTVLEGFEDLELEEAGHEGCGASKFVEKSVAEPIEHAVLVGTFGNLGADRSLMDRELSTLRANKQRRLEAGFYSGWDPAWHADFLISREPQNFSYLAVQDDEVHGHYASGAYSVREGSYFAKNDFIADTGKYAFALTFGVGDKIAALLGADAEERKNISLGFKDDSFNVTNCIVGLGMEVYAAA